MNILQILPTLDVGGVETGTVDLARYLVACGHKAIVVSGGGSLVSELDKIGSRHYTLPVGKKSLLNIINMVREVSAIIKSEDIDIVHARSRVPALIAYFACKLTNRAFITTAHGYYSKHIMSESMSWGRYVIVASNIMAKHMMDSFGVPYERIRLIPRGVDLTRFPFIDPNLRKNGVKKDFVVGMVSRITPLKGHRDFIKAVSILKRKIPELKVRIVGSAPKSKYMEDLELLVKQLGLSGVVEFLGARTDVSKVMSEFDVLVLATITPEAFGRVIIEAQATGVPVVATRVGGVVDIIDDEITALLCNVGNPSDMADKVLRIYNDKALACRMISAARKKVEEEFDLDKMTSRTMAVYEETIKRHNILVIKLSATGDVILSIPALRAIRNKYPDANIKVLVGSLSREVLDNCPYINGNIVCDFSNRHKGVKGFTALLKELRSECFDMVFDLQNNKKSHILAFGSFAGLRYGYDNGKMSFLLNKKIKDDAPFLDPIEHQFRTLALAGIKLIDKKLELWPSDSDNIFADKFLEDNWLKEAQVLVGINISASSKWPTKNWPESFIAELSDKLSRKYNTRVVLTGGHESDLLARKIKSLSKSNPIIMAGKTGIMELASIIKKCNVFLTPDSAPMHIAAAVGTPCIALFGPTDPIRHVVPSEKLIVLSGKEEVKCSPCYKRECSKKINCMHKISVDEVALAMEPYLKK